MKVRADQDGQLRQHRLGSGGGVGVPLARTSTRRRLQRRRIQQLRIRRRTQGLVPLRLPPLAIVIAAGRASARRIAVGAGDASGARRRRPLRRQSDQSQDESNVRGARGRQSRVAQQLDVMRLQRHPSASRYRYWQRYRERRLTFPP